MSLSTKIRKGKHVLRSFLFLPKPENFSLLIFAITYLCNSKCNMCNIWQIYQRSPQKYNEELTNKEIRRIFCKSELLKQIQYLLIAGGEPFLKKDFVDIILFFYGLNPSLTILIASNGQRSDLIEEKLKVIRRDLVKRGIQEYALLVGIALDGMEEAHDTIHGLKGSFQRALDTAERIRKIESLNVGFQFTFTPQNFREFTLVYDLSKRLDIPLSFQLAQVSGHYYDNKEQQFKWTDEQLSELRYILTKTGYFDVLRTECFDNMEHSGSLANRIFGYNLFLMEYAFEYQRNPKRSFDCFSGTHSCFLNPYGYLYPCIMLEKSFGNIREQNFDDIWKSPVANQIRDSISGRECHCCSFCDTPHSLERNWRIIPWNLKNMVFHAKKI